MNKVFEHAEENIRLYEFLREEAKNRKDNDSYTFYGGVIAGAKIQLSEFKRVFNPNLPEIRNAS